MLNSTEHEILKAHKYKNIKTFNFFSGSDKLIILSSLLINVKMPIIVGILTFMGRKKSCSAELTMKHFYNHGAILHIVAYMRRLESAFIFTRTLSECANSKILVYVDVRAHLSLRFSHIMYASGCIFQSFW